MSNVVTATSLRMYFPCIGLMTTIYHILFCNYSFCCAVIDIVCQKQLKDDTRVCLQFCILGFFFFFFQTSPLFFNPCVTVKSVRMMVRNCLYFVQLCESHFIFTWTLMLIFQYQIIRCNFFPQDVMLICKTFRYHNLIINKE